MALIVGTLAACSTAPPGPARPSAPTVVAPAAAPTAAAPAAGKSRWVPASWDELPGFADDTLYEAWNAWLKSCERPAPTFAPLCREVRQLSIASSEEQRAWMVARLQPYRIEAADGNPDGLLTGYYEPLFDAARQPGNGFSISTARANIRAEAPDVIQKVRILAVSDAIPNDTMAFGPEFPADLRAKINVRGIACLKKDGKVLR